jgi:hypothetical protein
MHYKSKMLSLKRSGVVVTLAGLSLALIAGCGTHKAPTAATKPPAPDTGDTMEPNILAWDAVSKEYHAHPGDKSAPFSFSLTNVSTRQVVIYDTQTSCDCTVAKLPSQPWTIPSGGSGKIEATIDLSGKTGTVTNSVIVFTSQGNRRLNVKAILPDVKK